MVYSVDCKFIDNSVKFITIQFSQLHSNNCSMMNTLLPRYIVLTNKYFNMQDTHRMFCYGNI